MRIVEAQILVGEQRVPGLLGVERREQPVDERLIADQAAVARRCSGAP